MPENIFKFSFNIYVNIEYESSNPIESDSKYEYNDGGFQIRKNRPKFIHKDSDEEEDTFVKNYGNPLFTIHKQWMTIVVEKKEDKVSLKFFTGNKTRHAGCVWFKTEKNLFFITVNTKTGDVYNGSLIRFESKKKFKKLLRKNKFSEDPISWIKSAIKNYMIGIKIENQYDIVINALTAFISEIDNVKVFNDLDFSQRLFKFYLTKKKIKYPNNFHVHMKYWDKLFSKKILKKNDYRLVDSYMDYHDISGKKIKKALHHCDRLNLSLYTVALNIFGPDWVNQDENLILKCLNYYSDNLPYFINLEIINYASNEEMKRVFELFKQVYVQETMDGHVFYDHISLYIELKKYGEDVKWLSYKSNDDFRKEHLDWTEKLQFYKNGKYVRVYPKYLYDLLKPIKIGIDTYHPILLDTSELYTMESSMQSNCVKTYTGRAGSIIISLRKNSIESDERATVEYYIKQTIDNKHVQIKRVQFLGKYNQKLPVEWDEPLFNLDEQMLYYVNDKRFDTVKLRKECVNGALLNSDSDWNEDGILKWTYKEIVNN
jgi:hypothetical protein